MGGGHWDRLGGRLAPPEARVESEAGVQGQVSRGSAAGGWCPATFKRATRPPKGTKSLDRAREVARKQGQLSIMFLPVFFRWPRSRTA